MSLYSLSSFKLFWDPSKQTKALLAWGQDTAVLAFRGTASLTNAWSDLQVLRLVQLGCAQVHLTLAATGQCSACMKGDS